MRAAVANSLRGRSRHRGCFPAEVVALRAWVIERPRPLEDRPLQLRDVPVPEPGLGQVRVRVRACAVCRTDVHIAEGELPPVRPWVIPGHQIVGVVDALGEGADRVPGVAPGRRVGVPWLMATCGHCAYCLEGRENLCEHARCTGYHEHGGFAPFVVVPADAVVPLPDRYGDVEAAPLLCAGLIGYRSLKVAGVRPGDSLALFGFGASAHIALQLARAWGCRVAVFSRSAHHRRLAEELGAAWTGQVGERPPFAVARAITFAPAGWLVPEALRVLRRGGTLAINAVHMDAIPAFDYGLLYWERQVSSVANLTRQDAREFMELADRIPLRVHAEPVPFDEAPDALVRVKRGAVQGALVLVVDGR